jgi:NTE family protein
VTPPVIASGLVLTGGGARAAYQVGALRGVAQVLGKRPGNPFPILCGTSAGAINAATLAIHADDFRRGVAQLTRWWRHIEVSNIYRADLATLSSHGVRWLAALLGVGTVPKNAASMLESDPLAAFLAQALDLSRVQSAIDGGHLHALAINATSYATGHAVTFFQGAESATPWRRMRRRGERAKIGIDHLMASTAIPFVFPAVSLGEEYYMDGSVRQISPLSAALHLGARNLLIVAVGQFAGQSRLTNHVASNYPSFAQAAGHALSSIFLDNLGADVERLLQMNEVVDLVSPQALEEHGVALKRINALVLAPSRDLGALAATYAERLPRGVRTLLRGFGSQQGTGSGLVSYLLFDREYCDALMELGLADALARRDEIEAFLEGSLAHIDALALRDFF